MANIMSQVKLKNKTSRNAFDLSRKNAFTAKVGELLPVACIECIPGDNIKGRVEHFTRTMPVNTAAYTRIREYYDWFFVPTNLLWNKFNTFVTQMTNNTQHALSITTNQSVNTRHPYFTVSQIATYINSLQSMTEYKNNVFGFNRAELTVKLLNYLGYGDYRTALGTASGFYNENALLNPFPLLAYQKIYQDYFRHSQWESSSSPSFNVDYISGQTAAGSQLPISTLYSGSQAGVLNMFDLRYSNWNKDLFMGLQPNAQYGAAATINTMTFGSTSLYQVPFIVTNEDGSTPSNNANITTSSAAPTSALTNSRSLKTLSQNVDMQFNLTPSLLSSLRSSLGLDPNGANFSILALRQAEALQKWKEITQSQNQDYKNQIEAHFGVSMSDAYSERAVYVDGSVNNLDISEVVNTNITGSNASDIAGKGVGVGDASFNYESKVHGYLMCIYHAVPLLDYSISGINRTNLKSLATDYAIPEFDQTGMVQVPLVELSNSSTVNNFVGGLLGYAPRYYDYKQAIDEVHGAFRGSLGSWVAPVTDAYINNYVSGVGVNGLTYNFFKVNPATLNPIFVQNADSSVDTDQLLCNVSFEVTAVRNLDRNGLPY